jgi:hypothetical protein
MPASRARLKEGGTGLCRLAQQMGFSERCGAHVRFSANLIHGKNDNRTKDV